jgi:hypothetical protein
MKLADIRIAGAAFFICFAAACAAALAPEDTATETVAEATVADQVVPATTAAGSHGALIGGTGASYESW